MSPVTRRGFLWQTSAGAAAVALLPAATTLGPVEPAPATWAVAEAEVPAAALSEPLVAIVRNAAQGEVALLTGTREVLIRDAELVSRLVKATG